MRDKRFAFGRFVLNPEKGTLLREGEPVALGHRGVLLLEAFLKNAGEVLTKADLMDAAWPGMAVEESNLSVQIALLRKALEPRQDGEDRIVTIPRVGYRFVPDAPAHSIPQAAAKASLAVLPFVNQSNDREQEFFADGLAEEIITALSKLSGLLVVARGSSFAYKGSALDVRKIAVELGVRHVLEGSVSKSDNRVRMAARLVDAETGGHVWAERYDRELADIFAIQDDVTRQIAEALKVVLLPAERLGRGRGGTRNVAAFDRVLRARAVSRGPTQNLEIHRYVVGLLREAIDHDPDYAEAYAGLAIVHVINHQNRWTDDAHQALAEGRRAADQAIEKDPGDAQAHAAAALVAMHGKDYERWALEVETALSLDRDHPLANNLQGHLHFYEGRPLAAIPHIERAMRLDPGYVHGYLHHLGAAYLIAGRYETAAALFRERILMVPDTDMSRAYLAAALGHLGMVEEAHRVWRELKALSPEYSLRIVLHRLPFRNPADVEHILAGLAKASLGD